MWSPPNVKTVGWSKSMKISFGVTVLVMVLLFILLILQQISSYYSGLVWGTIIVIVGSSGSQLLPEWKKHKWLKWIRAICIAIVIAVGALLTTYGWNEKNVINQKNSIIRSVCQEWKLNASIINDPIFHEPNEAKISKYAVFPRMQTTVLAGALSSGHFTDKSDPNFWTQALGLNEVLGNFNNRLRITEDQMARRSHDIYKLRTTLRDGKTLASVMEKLLLFGIMLNSEYSDMLINEYGEEFGPIENIDEIKKHIESVGKTRDS